MASTVTLTDLKTVSTSNGSIITGNITTTVQSTSTDLIIEGIGNTLSTIIIVPSDESYKSIKTVIEKAPVTPNEIIVNDYRGFPLCKYAQNRSTNTSGTVSFSADPAVYLKDIIIPRVSSSDPFTYEILIPITDYSALSSIYIESNKQKLLYADFNEFYKNIGDNHVHIFTDQYIYDYIKLFINIDKITVTVVQKSFDIIGAMIEYICGPTIYKPLEKFQGFIDFSKHDDLDYLNVLHVVYKNDIDSDIALTARTKGRVHILGNGTCSFVIVLSHVFDNSTTIQICNSCTSTIFKSIVITDMTPYESNLINEYIDVIRLNIIMSNNISEQSNIIKTHPDQTMKYMFMDMTSIISEYDGKNVYMKIMIDDFFKKVSNVQMSMRRHIVTVPTSIDSFLLGIPKFPKIPSLGRMVTCASPSTSTF